MTFAEIGAIILPVFGLIGCGFAAAKARLLDDSVGTGLGEFVFVVAVPLLMFKTVGTAQFGNVSPWGLWLSYFGGVLPAWGLGSLVATRLFGRSRAEAVVAGISASFANTVMVGIPLIHTAYGEAGVVPIFLLLSVHLPTMMVAGTMMTERAVRLDRGVTEPLDVLHLLRRIGRNLATNPFVIALVAGAAFRLSGLPLGGVPGDVIDRLAGAAGPCALFSLGMALKRYGLFGEFRFALVLALIKLLIMPAVVLVLAHHVFALPPLSATVMTLAAACPSGANSYLFAVRFGIAHGTASNSIGLSTALAVVTMALWFDVIARVLP